MYKRFAAPLRVLSAIDIAGRLEARRISELELDCLRAENDDDWWTSIQILAEHAPILVLDATATTPGVVREYQHVINEGLEYKSIFVSGPNGECALCSNVPDKELPARLCLVSEQTALGIVDKILTTGTLPTRERPVGPVPPIVPAVRLFRNPYKMIMMRCPVSERVVETGVNSYYFESWNDNPPKGGAVFKCPACGQRHAFDKSNTWLEEIAKNESV
jgi:hypothetical protein